MPAVSVLGTGLIGASVGLGLAAAGWEVGGWDPAPERLAAAAGRGAVHHPAAGEAELLARPADLVVLAGPSSAIAATVARLSTDGLVTDVAGVKGAITAAGRHLAHFVPGHPMAGREVSGPAAASGALFRGAAWVLVTDHSDPADLDRIGEIVEMLGARPLRMTAADHDAAAATVSHLPQVLAAALLRTAAEAGGALELAAGSFRDLTRVAASDPAAWADLLVNNRSQVAERLRRFAARLESWAGAVEAGDAATLREALGAARSTRAGLGPAAVAVQVALADRPGELARVGHALESSAVDVRDLQLRHAPHGGGGILSLYVRPADADGLRAALVTEGLLLADG